MLDLKLFPNTTLRSWVTVVFFTHVNGVPDILLEIVWTDAIDSSMETKVSRSILANWRI